MRRFFALTLFALLLGRAWQADSDGEIVMDQDKDTQFPTWTKVLPVETLITTKEELSLIASKMFNNVKKHPVGLTVSSRSCLVAALYDPVSQTVYASTIPRNDGEKHIWLHPENAPVWWSRAEEWLKFNEGKPTASTAGLHAEDGAYNVYESATSVGRGLSDDDLKVFKYPGPPMLAIWGVKGWDPLKMKELKTTDGRDINPCDYAESAEGYKGRWSCKKMAASLGVQWQEVAESAAEQAQDADPATGEEQCDRPEKRHWARDATFACSPPPDATDPPTTPSATLPACTLQTKDAAQGINTAYCVCENSPTSVGDSSDYCNSIAAMGIHSGGLDSFSDCPYTIYV